MVKDWDDMSLEEKWAKADKDALNLMRKKAMKSRCPRHVWIKTKYSSTAVSSDMCLICGLRRTKKQNQYRYRYNKSTKKLQEDIDERWEMYNQGVNLIQQDKKEIEELLARRL